MRCFTIGRGLVAFLAISLEPMSNPYQSPQFAQAPVVAELSPTEREKMRRVASRQQFVLYSLLANIVINIVFMAMPPGASTPVRGMLGIIALSVVIATMIAAFLLAWELYNMVIGMICAVLMPIPCVALLTLLIINGKATKFLQQRGVKVGLMGVNPNTI
jgi:hypothetical protein